MEIITTHVHVASTPAKVLEAITTAAGQRAWWMVDCDVGRAAGDEAVYRFDGMNVVFRIDRLDARGIEMTCIRNMGFADWQGTHLTIRAMPEGMGTYVDLLHDGFRAKNALFDMCASGWTHYGESLRSYCETGRGMPYGSVVRARQAQA